MNQLVGLVKRAAISVNEVDSPSVRYATLLKAVGDARVVMIGEASHGTQEFYKERAEITKLLIEKKGFNCVAIEGDWPDTYNINKYIRGSGEANQPEKALGGFKRFPRWMWRNEVILDVIRWFRDFNDSRTHSYEKVGFYGLDLYSLFESAHEVIEYLEKVDPESARAARKRYACFDRFGGDAQTYGYATSFGMSKTCQQEVTQQLIAVMKRRIEEEKPSEETEDLFCARQNAKVVKDAEEYYRSMFTANTWNMRDRHMVDTLDDILNHLRDCGPDKPVTKAVIWAHNSHLGDASCTESSRRGETNVGELVRNRYGLANTFNIGFTTYTGTVSAADEWDAPRQTKKVRPGLKNSFEELFHKVENGFFYLIFRKNQEKEAKAIEEWKEVDVTIDNEVVETLSTAKLERAIGVIYRPETERLSHYFDAKISKQFDAVIHIDKTNALVPLDDKSVIEEEEPETFHVFKIHPLQ